MSAGSHGADVQVAGYARRQLLLIVALTMPFVLVTWMFLLPQMALKDSDSANA